MASIDLLAMNVDGMLACLPTSVIINLFNEGLITHPLMVFAAASTVERQVRSNALGMPPALKIGCLSLLAKAAELKTELIQTGQLPSSEPW